MNVSELPDLDEDGEDSGPDALAPEAVSWAGPVAPSWAGGRLDRALVALYPGHSRSHLQSLIESGQVRVDGRAETTPARKLRLGQRLEVDWTAPRHEAPFAAEDLPIDTVFEDAHLLVLNKPAGWVVHPAAGNWSGTLLNALLAHHEAASGLPRAGIVHRLDKDTSGLMVVAKTLPAYHHLVAQLAARSVSREYLAVCQGGVDAPFEVDAPIGRDPRQRVRMAVHPLGKPARTDFSPLAQGERCSLLHCRLHSGRTHQIRVHAAHRGHPLLGDTLYGGRAVPGLARQALHAARLSLDHPATGRRLSWSQELPEDLLGLAQQLFGRGPGWLPAAA